MLKNWIKIFLYQARKNAFFTALNVLGLSLGIAGLIFATLYWNDEQSYDKWNPDRERIYNLLSDLGETTLFPHNVYPLAKYLEEIPEVESYSYMNNWYYNEIVHYGNKKEQIKIMDGQSNFFSFFPFEFIRGSKENALPDNSSISIEESVAERLFGKEDPIGKQVKYSGRLLTVRGVYKIQGKSSIAPQAVTNLLYETRLKDNENSWGNFNFCLLIKIKNANQIAVVKKKVDDIILEHRTKLYAKGEGISLEEFVKNHGTMTVVPEALATARLHSVVDAYPEGKGSYQFLLIMVGLSVLILVLSITNYVNLSTANAIKRAKEVGVRKILGATKANVVKQFLFETFITTIVALLLALVIVELSLPYYNDFLDKTLVINSSLFYWQLIIIFVTVLVFAGIFPSVYVANFEVLNVLRGNFNRTKSGVWLRNSMLVLQFAIATFFIVGSYIVYLQVNHLTNKDLGVTGKQVISAVYRKTGEDTPQQILNRYNSFKSEILKIKGVDGVSAGAFNLGSSAGSSSGFGYHDKGVQAQNMAVDFDFLSLLKIKMAKGRELSSKFASDTINSMLINETAMKLMNEPNPIGKEITWNGQNLKIVGVVKDFNLTGPHNEIPPMSFFHFKTIDWMAYNLDRIYIKIDPENMQQTLTDLDKFWTTRIDTEYPFQYDFVDKTYERTYMQYVKQRNLFSLLNIVVVAIALFGLFSLASYSIQRRMKEIAIRKTLGAETATLLKELSKQYVVFCIIGFAIAIVPAWVLLDKWLENFAYRIDVSIWPFIIGFVLLLLLTLITVLGRAYMATRVNVLKYLKYE
nr:ABC transporter permease [uncultured Flavobacterium sp.]